MREKTKFAETLYGMMSKENVFLTYFGQISPDITDALLKIVKYDSTNFGERVIIKKKIYKIIVECLENVWKHSSFSKDMRPAVLLLGKQDDFYYVITGNYVLNGEIDGLKERINTVNEFDKEQIRSAYNEVLSHRPISAKGGAGLGMIDIVLKAENKLIYDFIPVDDATSFYVLRVKVNLPKQILSK